MALHENRIKMTFGPVSTQKKNDELHIRLDSNKSKIYSTESWINWKSDVVKTTAHAVCVRVFVAVEMIFHFL